MTSKIIVVDANILIRAVLGKRVRQLIYENCGTINFIAPDLAFDEANKYLPSLMKKHGIDNSRAMPVFENWQPTLNLLIAKSMTILKYRH